MEYMADTQEHITEDAIANSATNLVPVGSVLIVVKSKILLHSLPVAITTASMCFGQDLKGLVCGSRVLPEFGIAYSRCGHAKKCNSRPGTGCKHRGFDSRHAPCRQNPTAAPFTPT